MDNALHKDCDPLPGMPDRLELRDSTDARAWATIPTRAAQVLALLKIGFTVAEIAKGYGVTAQTIKHYRAQYDPQGSLVLPATAGKAILAARFEATAARALAGVTPEKMEAASAVALTTIAGIAADKALRMREALAIDNAREDVATLASALRAHLAPQADTVTE